MRTTNQFVAVAIGLLFFAMHTVAQENEKKEQKQETPKAEYKGLSAQHLNSFCNG